LKSIGIDNELQQKLAEKARKEKEAEGKEAADEPPPPAVKLPPVEIVPAAERKDNEATSLQPALSTSLPNTSPMAQLASPNTTPKGKSPRSSSKVRWATSPDSNDDPLLKEPLPTPPPPIEKVPVSPPSPWRIKSPQLVTTPATTMPETTTPTIAATSSEEDAADQIVLLGRYLPSKDPIRCSDTEIIIPALDVMVAENASSAPVILQFLKDPNQVIAEINSREGLIPSYVIAVTAVFADDNATPILPSDLTDIQVRKRRGLTEEVSSLNLGCKQGHSYLLVLEDHGPTLQNHIMCFPKKNLDFARDVIADVVVASIVLHTESRVHRDLQLRNIVRTKKKGSTRWNLKGFRNCTSLGQVGDIRTSHWGYWPPEVAALYQDGNEEAIQKYQADTSWDLWSIGCVLYRLVFGSDLWTASAEEETIDHASLTDLSKWSALEVLKRAEKEFPVQSRTDQEKAAIDLVSRLLVPTPNERKKNFEIGIISVHQHEFLEGKPLDPHNLNAFEEQQKLLSRSCLEQERFVALTESLSLEEKWELNRARDVLLTGALEPANVHFPTNYVILKEPLPDDDPDETATAEAAQACLFEGMRWSDLMDDLGPLVLGALDGDVSAVGRFWSKIKGMFEGSYVYLYFIDDLTGEPVRLDPNNEGGFTGNCPYPIPIMTWSDMLPKLIPLMHLSMRSMALYHGAAGIARMFGSTLPILPEKLRGTVQAKIDELKHESTGSPFAPLGEDIELARVHRERFLQSDRARCKCLREYARFLERKGLIPGEEFARLRRIADKHNRAIWTTLDTAESVKDAIAKRKDERLKEEMKLWGDKQEYEIVELKKKTKEQEKALSQAVESVEKAKEDAAKEATESKATDVDSSVENERIKELKASLAQARNDLKKSRERVEFLEETARQQRATPSPSPLPSPASVMSAPVTHIQTVGHISSSPPKVATQYIAPPSKTTGVYDFHGGASVDSNSTQDQDDDRKHEKKKKKKWQSIGGKKK